MSKVSDSDALEYISQLSPKLRGSVTAIHQCLSENGCNSYVKTIYVGYELGGEMVAAIYGHADHIDLALALPEDDPDPSLLDASHLTWRTLPVLIEVSPNSNLRSIVELAERACERVRSGIHDVRRDNEFFAAARERRRAPNAEGGRR